MSQFVGGREKPSAVVQDGPFVRIFGGIAVDDDGEPVSIGGPRQRRLLALLVVRPNSVVSNDWLAENLWQDDDRPEAIAPAIRTYISRLRLALPEVAQPWIETEPSGYRWVGPPDALEHRWFVKLRVEANEARDQDDPATSYRLLGEALASWRGDPFRELEDLDWARAEVEQLRLDRLEMQEERWESALALGRHTQITGELAAFTAEHGLRDRAARQYALALHRSGRTAEALRVLDDHRRHLADVSGLDPSPALVELEQAMLSGDPSLTVETRGRPLRGYRLVEQAGEGAFAVVWRGYQPSVDREVAIKQIRSELASRPDFIRRFEAEAHLVARLQHPHVVPLIDYWRDPDSAYLVMRWLPGGTLEQRLHDGPLTVDATLTLAQQIGTALAAAHRHGVVHRDVKSGNILFDEDDNAYLSDFGIALQATESATPETALSPGSPAYAAPEQLRGERLGPEADIFSLGVVIFECLTAALPYGARPSRPPPVEPQTSVADPNLADLRPDLAPSISGAVAKATASAPHDRFRTVEDFLTALEPEPTPADRDRDQDGDAPSREDGRTAGSTESITNPYKGLRAFHDADADQFFGRDHLVDELVARLQGDTIQSRCVVVVGPSGSGKSSVVRAGLLPALRSGVVPGSSTWFTTTMVPGANAFESLEAALLRIAVNPPPSMLAQLRDGERGVLRSVRRCLTSDDDVVVVVIDQFEEVFTGDASDDARHFLDALSSAVDDPISPLRLVLTLRADYYDRPLEHPSFAPILKQTAVDVTPLAPDELEQAIVEPARRQGVAFEPGLVARIVADTIGQPSPLPLLQYSLSELFDLRTGEEITAAAYDALGGLSGALAARAESLYTRAAPAEQAAIRRVFGRMTNPGEEAADLRRRVPLADLGHAPEVGWVLDEFGAARLFTFDRDVATREPTVEVAHEALLREWPRVVTWLQDDRDVLRLLDSVAVAANAWEQGGREETDLYRGARLETAIGLADTASDRLRPVDRDFIAESRNVAEAERDQEQRRVRRLRQLVAGVGGALVLALLAGAIAFIQRNDAEAAAAEAEVVGLISRSAAVGVDDPDLAVLLALEAHRRQPGSQTERAVLDSLSANTVANRVSSLGPPFEGSAEPCPATAIYPGAAVEFAVFDGQLITRDPLTGTVTERGQAPARCVVWMADEQADRRIAVALDGRQAWFGPFNGPWETERRFDEATRLCTSCAFNTGRRMLFGSEGEGSPVAVVLDDRTGEQIGDPISSGGDILTGVLNQDGSLAAVSFTPAAETEDGQTIVVDGRTGDEIHRLDIAANDLVFDDATGELLAGTLDGTVATIDMASGQVVSSVETAATSAVLDVGIRSDGLLVVTSQDRVDTVDRRTGPTGSAVDLTAISYAELRADGTLLTGNLAGSRVEIFELTGNALADRIVDLVEPSTVSFRSGSAVVVGHASSTVDLVDLATGSRSALSLPVAPGEAFDVLVVAADSDGFLAMSTDAGVARWEDGRMTERVETAGQSGAITIGMDAILAEQATEMNLGSGHLVLLRRKPNAELDVAVVNIDPGEMELVSTTEFADLVTLAVDPDGGFHVLHADGVLRTYDTTGSMTAEWPTGFFDFVGAGSASELDLAGRKVAFGTASGAFIFEPSTGEITIVPTFGSVSSLTFARDGQLLAIGSADGSVRLWDVDQEISRGVLWRGTGRINLGSWYDEESDAIWVVSETQLIRLPLNPAIHLERACEIVDRDLTQEEWDRFVPGGGTVQSACSPSG